MSHDPYTHPLSELACPQCHDATRVIDRFTLGGSPGAVEHVKVICERGHWFTLPLERLATVRDQDGVTEAVEATASEKAA